MVIHETMNGDIVMVRNPIKSKKEHNMKTMVGLLTVIHVRHAFALYVEKHFI